MRLGCLNGACLLVAMLCVGTAAAQQPPATIDTLIDRILDLRAKKAELDKQEAAARTELDAAVKAQRERLDKLGVTPPPPGPKPVDALVLKLREAFETDKGTRDEVLQLAALYREAAKLSASKDVPSSRELLRRVRDAGTALVGPDSLTGTRTVAAGELAAVLGAPSDAAMTDAQRVAVAALFARLATILEAF
jgi:hypothetical protein